MSLISGADIAFLYDALRREGKDLTHGKHALASLQLAQVSGESIASILGGLLVTWSFRHVIVVHVMMSWVPFFLSLTFDEPQGPKRNYREHIRDLVVFAKATVAEDRLLRLIFANLVIWGLSSFIAVWLFQRYWQDRGIALSQFGLIWAAYNISVGIIGKQVHRLQRRFGPIALLAALGVAPILAYLGMAATAGWIGVGLGLLFYLSRGITQVFLKEAFNRRVPAELRATANSFHTFAFRLVFAICGPAVGYCVDRFHISMTLTLLGGIFLAAFGFAALPLIKVLRSMTNTEAIEQGLAG